MKKISFLLVMMFYTLLHLGAQEFVAPNKQSSTIQFVDTATTYTYRMPDNIYKVYKSKSGAFYIWKISKRTNKPYKMYLPKEVQIKMGRKYNK